MFQDITKDLTYAIRVMRRHPGFAGVVVLTLALGIGANTALFSVVNGVLLSPLPFPEPNELVAIHESKLNFQNGSISYPNFRDWQRDNHTFAAMAISRGSAFTLTGRGDAEQIRAQYVTSDFFRILGVQPLAGRAFAAGEDEIGAPPLIMVSEGFWTRKLNSSPGAVGQSLALDGRDYTIIGIVPAGFDLPVSTFRPSDVYAPIGQWSNNLLNVRSAGLGIHGIGRLKPGIPIEQARADMALVTRNLTSEYPDVNKGIGASMVPLREAVVGNVRPYLLVLVGAVAFVLLIACVNVSNLLLARATGRRGELAVRVALGASPTRLMRQLVTESVLLAFAGGALGLLAARWGTRAALAALPTALPRAADVNLDARVLLFAMAVSLVAGAVFGLAPAWRTAQPDLHETLKECGRGSGGARHRTQAAFVVLETALAVVLLVGAGLMLRTLTRLWNTDPGFRADHVLTFGVNLSSRLSKTSGANLEAIRAADRQLHDAVASSPGVANASLLWGAFPMGGDDEALFWPAGQPRPASPNDMLWALRYVVEPDYLASMRIALVRGRFFSASDDEHAPLVAVVDDVFARKFFSDRDPVGQKLNVDMYASQAQIIGVVGHVNQWGLDRDDTQSVRAQLYLAFMQLPDDAMWQTPAGMGVVVRSDGSVPGVMAGIRRAVASMSRDQVTYGAQTMEEIIAGTIAARRFAMALFGAFAVAALALASLGIYGVLSHLVGQRMHELGVRIALGARPRDVAKLVLGEGLVLSLGGAAIGLVGAVALTRLMANLLFGVSPIDPLTYAGVVLLLTLVALAACWLPARRATHADPLIALRSE